MKNIKKLLATVTKRGNYYDVVWFCPDCGHPHEPSIYTHHWENCYYNVTCASSECIAKAIKNNKFIHYKISSKPIARLADKYDKKKSSNSNGN